MMMMMMMMMMLVLMLLLLMMILVACFLSADYWHTAPIVQADAVYPRIVAAEPAEQPACAPTAPEKVEQSAFLPQGLAHAQQES